MAKTKRVGLTVALIGGMVLSPWVLSAENMSFHGILTESQPCTINDGENIQLDFGTVIDKYLYLNGRTNSKPFQLHLIDCDTSLANTLKMTLSGTESIVLPGLLAPDGSSQARGIAIGLETQDGQSLALNQQGRGQEITDGNNTIILQAYIKGEPEAITNKAIKKGMFTAVATFELEYD